jgi:hypothetical protein
MPGRLLRLPTRTLDPVLGIFTGVLAYYLYETHPRTAIPSDERLSELAKWKWSKWRREQEHGPQATGSEQLEKMT